MPTCMKWKHFQQKTGWILGAGETSAILVGGFIAFKYGIPGYFWLLAEAEPPVRSLGEVIFNTISPLFQ